MKAIIVVDMWKNSRGPKTGIETEYHADNIILAELISRMLSYKMQDTDLYYTYYNNQTANTISPTITDIPGIKPLHITDGTIDSIPEYDEYLLCGASLGVCMFNYSNQIKISQPDSTVSNIINLSLPYPTDADWVDKTSAEYCTLYYGDIKYW
jgi:hypothetical protein